MNTRPNLPEIVEEVTDAFSRYERALVDNDLAALASFFHDGDNVIRFGINDMQQGASELAQWRLTQRQLPPGRTLVDTKISSFGLDFAVVSTRFFYPGRPFLGRQSQTWVRLEDGWCIVHAHVSEVPAESPTG